MPVSTQLKRVLGPDGLDDLITALRRRGYCVIGPTRRDGAIVYEEIDSAAALPAGWRDVQEAGSYRLERREDEARFGYAVGPHSWKQFLFPPRVRLWRARRTDDGALTVHETPPEEGPYAFIGVRSCELHAMAIQDRVFVGGTHVDGDYAARREGAFIVAVNCIEAGGTCFCVSMDTGPQVRSAFDLALTELLDGEHRLLLEAGSERGAMLLAELPGSNATENDVSAARQAVASTAEEMGRHLDVTDLRDLLASSLEHPRWDRVAERCLTCGNCTLVCPTCFCSTVEDVTDLQAAESERFRSWDTCFSVMHSYIHGGAIRPSGRSRYRQWLTHKFGTWHDQFGSSGCVGCGRCITWCPVGIDVTEELAALRSEEVTPVGND